MSYTGVTSALITTCILCDCASTGISIGVLLSLFRQYGGLIIVFMVQVSVTTRTVPFSMVTRMPAQGTAPGMTEGSVSMVSAAATDTVHSEGSLVSL